MPVRVTQQQRESIGRAALAAVGTTPEEHRISPGSVVGVHSRPSGVVVFTIAIPFS